MSAQTAAQVAETVEKVNPLFDTTFLHSQLFWTGIAFVLILAVMWIVVLPRITKALDDRAEGIREDLDKAENLRKDAEQALATYEKQLKAARQEASSIVEQAKEEASKMSALKTKELEEELSRKAQQAAEQIAAAKDQALRDVQSQVAELALSAAEKLIEKEIDKKTAERITEDAIKRLN